jgi:hypothetical protein
MAKLSDFSFFLINARDSSEAISPYVSKAYDMWRGVWLGALSELEGKTDIHSDDFTRQELVGVLFHGIEAIGSVSFSSVNLALPMWRKDSYFSAWPEENLISLGNRFSGNQILICSYFTLAPKWRRDAPGFSAKRLLSALAVAHFINSSFSAMVGTMRVNRGMHKLCYDLGADAVLTDIQMHGVAVDLIVFDKVRMQANAIKGPMTKEAYDIYFHSQLLWENIKMPNTPLKLVA